MFFQKYWLKYRRQIFIVFLFLAPFTPFVFHKVEMPRIHFDDLANSYIVHPVAGALQNTRSGIRYLIDSYLVLVNTKQENEKLKDEVAALRQQLLDRSELVEENSRLRSILSIDVLAETDGVGARVIGQDTLAESLSFFIDVGENQGVKVNMPVISPDGVVGRIQRVFAKSSIFIALSDPSHALDARIERSRARAIVEGAGDALLARLKYLDRSVDVEVGDRILSSGMDGFFPKGLFVGEVVEVRRPSFGVLQEVTLRPAVDLGRLEEVLVLFYEAPTANGDIL